MHEIILDLLSDTFVIECIDYGFVCWGHRIYFRTDLFLRNCMLISVNKHLKNSEQYSDTDVSQFCGNSDKRTVEILMTIGWDFGCEI